MNPKKPAAQNRTVVAITMMLEVMSTQPIAICDEIPEV